MNKIQKRIEKIINNPGNVTISELIVILEYYGCKLIRIRGSHFIFQDSKGERYPVPVHNNKVKPYYIKYILKNIHGKN